MNILALTIFLAIVAIALFLGFRCLMASGKIRGLKKAKANLREEKANLSDALRRKGIQVDRLMKEIKRLEKNAKNKD